MKRFKQFVTESRLTPDAAHAIFKAHGLEPTKAGYIKGIQTHHPDKGGNPETAKNINAAWDVIKTGAKPTTKAAPKQPQDTTDYRTRHSTWTFHGMYEGQLYPEFKKHQVNTNNVSQTASELAQKHGYKAVYGELGRNKRLHLLYADHGGVKSSFPLYKQVTDYKGIGHSDFHPTENYDWVSYHENRVHRARRS